SQLTFTKGIDNPEEAPHGANDLFLGLPDYFGQFQIANSFSVLFMGHLIRHSHSNKHSHPSRRRKNEDTRAHLEIIKMKAHAPNPLHPKGCDMTPLHTSDPLQKNKLIRSVNRISKKFLRPNSWIVPNNCAELEIRIVQHTKDLHLSDATLCRSEFLKLLDYAFSK
ncbi:607_t:CDS:2, partial [Acaulospora morrowiae]